MTSPKYQAIPTPISSLIGKAFHGVHRDLRNKKYDEYWEAGGRGSLKSSFIAIEILLGIATDRESNAACFRKVGDTIQHSVKPTFIWAIRTLKWESFFHVPKSLNTITYLPTGQQILMLGLDDPLKIKSIKPRTGYFKYLWFEEGAEYSSLEELESVTQSVLRGGPEFVQMLSYNPPVEPKHWINVAAAEENRPANRSVHFSCYTDAPREWLGPKFLQDAEEMRRKKPDKYANVYLGKSIGRSDKIIFSGCYTVEAFDVERKGHRYFIGGREVDGPYFGADFGFANDPNTLVKCWRDPLHRKIYIEYAVFGYKVKLNAMGEFYDQVPGSRKDMIYGDCSRPETIVHVRDLGFIMDAAEKGTGSVEDGIEWLTGHEIVIHTRCEELEDEAVLYSYKVDRVTGTVKSDIVDEHNHGWDAVRYAFWQLIKQEPKGILDVDLLSEGFEEAEPSSGSELVESQYTAGDDFLH